MGVVKIVRKRKLQNKTITLCHVNQQIFSSVFFYTHIHKCTWTPKPNMFACMRWGKKKCKVVFFKCKTKGKEVVLVHVDMSPEKEAKIACTPYLFISLNSGKIAYDLLNIFMQLWLPSTVLCSAFFEVVKIERTLYLGSRIVLDRIYHVCNGRRICFLMGKIFKDGIKFYCFSCNAKNANHDAELGRNKGRKKYEKKKG